MFSTARSILPLATALVVLAPSASAFDSPLSDTAVRSAYFLVTLEFSPSAFSSQLGTIEVTGPDGQIVRADFDLAAFR